MSTFRWYHSPLMQSLRIYHATPPPSIQGCAKVLVDGTAEGVCGHVKTLFDRGAMIVEDLRAILTDNGHDADVYLPFKSSAPFLTNLQAVMHDTCATANAAARRIIEAKNSAGIAFYGEEAWAALNPSERETFDGLCFNHTRQLPVTAYNRLSKAVLEELLAPYGASIARRARRRVPPSLRLQARPQVSQACYFFLDVPFLHSLLT